MTGDRPTDADASVAGVTSQIGELIAELIGKPIGADDNFFTAGLTSVTVARLHTMLRTRIGFDLPVTTLYGNPTARRAATAFVQRRNPPPPQPAGGRRAAPQRSRREIRANLRRDLDVS